MKILLSVDIEGVAGVYHPQQVRPGNTEYERARRWMTHEANAAIAGAFAGGARQVYVNDSHGDFRNLLADELDPRAQVIQGKPRYLSMAAGVELGMDGMCLIGYHARSKSQGILAHTINSFAFARVWFNDQEWGEAAIYGALAGSYGVPVIMAAGDDVFIEETRPLFSQGIQWVQTKCATGAGSGVSLSPVGACAAIEAAVAQAVPRCHQCAPLQLASPVDVRLQTQTPALADLFCQWPTMQRLDGDTLQYSAADVESAVRMLNCLSAMSSLLR